jgi:hypothetical protein
VHLGFYDDDIKKCNAELLYKIDSLKFAHKILYFGESSNFTTAEQDSSQQPISELLADMNPDSKLGDISKAAIHASTFKMLIKRIAGRTSVKTVIVTMNLRSFGINWVQSDLETNLSRADILYSNDYPIFKKFLLSFKGYNNVPLFKRKEIIKSHYKQDKFQLTQNSFKSVYEWDKVMYDKGIPDQNGNKDQEKTNIACHFIKNYAFVIDDNNPRIKDFDAIVKSCKEKRLQLIFHVLPENYERAAELCGTDLTELMEKNVEFLKNRYEKESVFINNYKLLPDSIFIDRQWPTEHYTFKGRYLVAKEISNQLKAN